MWRALLLSTVLVTSAAANAAPTPQPHDLPLVALIADPARHNGERVRVVGYLNFEFEGNAIYLNKADFDASVLANSLWVDRPRWLNDIAARALSQRYSVIEGTFRAGPGGHLGLWPGVIEDVRRAEAWPTRAEYAASIPHMPWWQEHRLPLAAGLIFVLAITGASYWLGRRLQRR
jgi:hypothetical protein